MAPFLIGLLVVASAGCSGSRDEPPVADSTMVDVLLELHLAVGRTEVTNQIPTNFRDSVLVAYGVDSTEYAATLEHYAEHPERYGEVYSRILDRLNSERIPLAVPDDDRATRPPIGRSPERRGGEE